MTKFDRIHAGYVKQTEKNAWKEAALEDGFTCLWTWIVWIVRNYIKQKSRRTS